MCANIFGAIVLKPRFKIDAVIMIIQGGSDKSGILKIFLENLTAQLKIIQFYKIKKQLIEGHIENQDIQ